MKITGRKKIQVKILHNRMVQHLDKRGVLHEGQARFRSCIHVDNIYTLNEIVQGRLREGKQTYAFNVFICTKSL